MQDIETSPTDSRKMKHFVLDNGLRVVLVHEDKET